MTQVWDPMTRFMIIFCACAAVSVGTLDASTASASTLIYSYSEPGLFGISFSFEQSSNPTPIAYVDGYYTEVPIWNATGAFAGQTAFVWYASVGGLNPYAYSPQGYSGPESAPVFAPGTFFGPQDPITGNIGILTAATIAMPEPSLWTIMLMGLGALGFMMRRPIAPKAA